MVPLKFWNVKVSTRVLFVVVEFGFEPDCESERGQGYLPAEEESDTVPVGPSS